MIWIMWFRIIGKNTQFQNCQKLNQTCLSKVETQQNLFQTSLFNTKVGHLQHPLRCLNDQEGNSSKLLISKYAFGTPAHSGNHLLMTLWQFIAVSPPTPLNRPTAHKKVFPSSIQSKHKLVWDCGRTIHLMT